MTLTDYIEAGAKKAESVAELARIIGASREITSAAKSLRRPLPLDCAIKLADYIEADRIEVISANELATEKKPEKRDFWSHLLSAQPKHSQTMNQRFTECRRTFIKKVNIAGQELLRHLTTAPALGARNAQSF